MGPNTQCGLCGRDPAAGTAGAWNDGVETRLCHGDDDPTPTCYSRWLHGERPELPTDLFVLSERGFVQGRPIPSAYGGAIKVCESSAAEAPHIWVMVHSPVDLNNPSGPEQEAVAHLTLENAIRLRDQLGHLTTRMVNDWGVEGVE